MLWQNLLKNQTKIEEILISNVSHELRSPITSIKGFVAGILDGVIPEKIRKITI